MTSIDLNSMTAMNLDGLSTKIAVNDLNVWYGKFHALKHITLAIPEGRVTAFIGPSGCGKSTLLRTFNRMYALYPGQRAEGELMLDGVNILSGTIDDCTLRSRVGMVFQRPTPFPMSIYDNIAYGIRLRENVAKSELDDRVEWALKKAPLERRQGQAARARHEPLGRPAAAPLHRPRRCRQARGPSARRAVLGP